MMTTEPIRFLRLPAVMDRVGVKETTIWRLVKRGEFPRPVKVTKYASAWVESEVNDYMAKLIAGRENQ